MWRTSPRRKRGPGQGGWMPSLIIIRRPGGRARQPHPKRHRRGEREMERRPLIPAGAAAPSKIAHELQIGSQKGRHEASAKGPFWAGRTAKSGGERFLRRCFQNWIVREALPLHSMRRQQEEEEAAFKCATAKHLCEPRGGREDSFSSREPIVRLGTTGRSETEVAPANGRGTRPARARRSSTSSSLSSRPPPR